MTKTSVNTIVTSLQKKGVVTKAVPWIIEGFGEKGKADVRYIGIQPFEDWLEIFSEKDNVLLKFILEKKRERLELYLANTTPFFRIYTIPLSSESKWETLLGPIKQRLKRDKDAHTHHKETADNLYAKIEQFLRA